MNWKSASEIVAGMVLTGKYDPNMLNSDTLFPPYDKITVMARAGADVSKMVADGIAYSAIDAALIAEQTVSKGEDAGIRWIKVLEQASSRAKAGIRIRKEAEKYENGDEGDATVIMSAIASVENGYQDMTPMSDVSYEGEDWMETGYKPYDEHFGGLPIAGLTILAASPGVGKTSQMLNVVSSVVKKYKDKKVAIFTLEMTMKQITKRVLQLSHSLTKEEKSRVLLSEEVAGVRDIYARAARVAASEPLALICIDFADMLVEGEQTEAIMGVIYRTLALLAKRTGIPVLLISQLNRETYNGGIPRINHLRYSGLAEATAAMILLIYNPTNIFVDFKDQQMLPSIAGVGYVIEGKSRFGYKHGGPGAVQIEWDGLAGWGQKPLGWYTLAGA